MVIVTIHRNQERQLTGRRIPRFQKCGSGGDDKIEIAIDLK